VLAILDCDWSPQTARLSLSMTHVSLTVLRPGQGRAGQGRPAPSSSSSPFINGSTPVPRPFHGSNPLPFPYNVDGRPYQGPQTFPEDPAAIFYTSTSAPKRQIVQAEPSRVESSRPAGVNRLLLLKPPLARRIFLGAENGKCPSLVMSNSSISSHWSPRSVREQDLGAD
jgi:hypothetical protein